MYFRLYYRSTSVMSVCGCRNLMFRVAGTFYLRQHNMITKFQNNLKEILQSHTTTRIRYQAFSDRYNLLKLQRADNLTKKDISFLRNIRKRYVLRNKYDDNGSAVEYLGVSAGAVSGFRTSLRREGYDIPMRQELEQPITEKGKERAEKSKRGEHQRRLRDKGKEYILSHPSTPNWRIAKDMGVAPGLVNGWRNQLIKDGYDLVKPERAKGQGRGKDPKIVILKMKVLEYMRAHPGMSNAKLANHFNITFSRITYVKNTLKKEGHEFPPSAKYRGGRGRPRKNIK